MKTAAILLAGGSGRRMAGALPDKVLAPAAGRPVIARSLAALADSGCIDFLVIAHRDDAQRRDIEPWLEKTGWTPARAAWTRGGAERQDSVSAGFAAIPDSIETVLIHDAARPLIRPGQIRELTDLVNRHGAAALCHAVVDTIKELPEAGAADPVFLRGLDRRRLRAMETPQGFQRDLLARMVAFVAEHRLAVTDDAAACEALGHPVALLENPHPNPKLTTPDDLALIEFLLHHVS